MLRVLQDDGLLGLLVQDSTYHVVSQEQSLLHEQSAQAEAAAPQNPVYDHCPRLFLGLPHFRKPPHVYSDPQFLRNLHPGHRQHHPETEKNAKWFRSPLQLQKVNFHSVHMP